VGGYLAGVAFLLIIVISIIYIKRRQRLRLQQARRVTTDSDRPPARGTQVEEASGTLTPFTLSLPFNTSSQLQTPRAEPSSTALPHEQPHTRDQPNPNQPPRSADPRADSVGDTVVEMMQNMQSMQRQLLHLLGERDRDDHRLRRTSAHQSGEDPIETRSDGTSDSPPTYKQ
jgi:hypothetical protein